MSTKTTQLAENERITYIDCTPTWQWCASVMIAVLRQRGEKGKDDAAKGLMEMADKLQHFANIQKSEGEVMLTNEIGKVCRPTHGKTIGSTDDKYFLELSWIDMHILTNALFHYKYRNNEYYDKHEEHRNSTERLSGLLSDLYCHDVKLEKSPIG